MQTRLGMLIIKKVLREGGCFYAGNNLVSWMSKK